jgi:hypothetical protein
MVEGQEHSSIAMTNGINIIYLEYNLYLYYDLYLGTKIVLPEIC